MNTRRILLFLLFPVVFLSLAMSCEKGYVNVLEVVRLKATLSNSNASIRLGDTLQVALNLPPTLTSESSMVTSVSSVQDAGYNLVLYRIDTLGGLGTRIKAPSNLWATRGTLHPNRSTVYTTTTGPPFQSLINIAPPTVGLYALGLKKGGLMVNNGGYKAFLRVNLDVPDKHWTLYDRYEPGYSTNPAVIRLDAEDNGTYYFMVR